MSVKRRHSEVVGRSTHSSGGFSPDPSASADETYDQIGRKEQITSQDVSPGTIGSGHFDPLASIRNLINGPATVTINDAGVTIEDGALTLKDEFGETVMVASGFAGTWGSYLTSGLYNADFGAGIDGAIPEIRGPSLPYWYMAKIGTSTVTRGASASFPSGHYVSVVPSAVNTGAVLESDAVAVTGLKDYLFGVVYAGVLGGSAQWRVSVVVGWYDKDLTVISSIGEFFDTPTSIQVSGVNTLRTFYGPTSVVAACTAPANARYAILAVNCTEITAHSASSEFRLGLISFKPDPLGASMNVLRKVEIGPLLIDPDTDSVTVGSHINTATLDVGYQERHGGTAFPGSPTVDDLYYRTDLFAWYFWTGSAWLSVEDYDTTTTQEALAITTAGVNRAPVPPESGGGSIWIMEHQVNFIIGGGGTALSASHKWVGVFTKVTPAGSPTTIRTITIDSGSSTVHRRDYDSTTNIVSPASYMVVQTGWTKTGTPGDLFVMDRWRYRKTAV